MPALMASKWGGLGTGWQGSAQPDNSGGQQRCVLIARGVGGLPLAASRCVQMPSHTTHARLICSRVPVHGTAFFSTTRTAATLTTVSST